MLIKEYPIEATFFQQILIPDTSNILKIVIKTEGSAVLLVEDLQDGCLEERVVGIYIVPSDDMRGNEIPENYIYLDSLKMASGIDVILFHVYIEAIDISDLFEDIPEEEIGGGVF